MLAELGVSAEVFRACHGAKRRRTMCAPTGKGRLHLGRHLGAPGIRREPKEGATLSSVDVTLILDGWRGNSSRCSAWAPFALRAERLIEVTYEA